MGEERIWAKRGSRIQLPHVPRPSRATLLRAIPSVGVVSLSLVGLLAVPAGSPPPPPVVAAAPIATEQPTDSPTVEPVTEPTPSEQPPEPLPACRPTPNATEQVPPSSPRGTATLVAVAHSGGISLFNPATNSEHELISVGMECGYAYPRFVDRRTLAFEDGFNIYRLDLITGKAQIYSTHVGFNDRVNDWLGGYSIASDGTTLAALGADRKSTWH